MNVMLLIGGDVIQKAVLQMAGFSAVTPVVFSFGWVTYTFNSMASGGKDLPDPDHAVTVIPVAPGALPVQNQSFLLGRLMRDLERRTRREIESNSDGRLSGLIVSAFEIDPAPRPGHDHCGPLKPCKDLIWWSFLPFLVVQLVVAAIPIILNRNWSIILITASGNALALVGASLPTIRRNKYACRRGSNIPFILTRGMGSRYAFLILPDTVTRRQDDVDGPPKHNSLPRLDDLAYGYTKSQTSYFYSVWLCFLWVVLLIAVGGLEDDTWYLFAVGSLGMAHSVVVASTPRAPENHGIPLRKTRGTVFQFGLQPQDYPRLRVHDILLQLEREYPGVGRALLPSVYGNFGDLPDSTREQWDLPDVSASSLQVRKKEWERQFYHTGELGEHK
ncbi:hypothetical protein F5883DRAFT_470952 [Diaporthe sp. PMI_573]|nr:hypothetical protein F5883DRAFT_470952 [Diaporthaceae sp. PMI_573]